jgi:hypothetical protein
MLDSWRWNLRWPWRGVAGSARLQVIAEPHGLPARFRVVVVGPAQWTFAYSTFQASHMLSTRVRARAPLLGAFDSTR